MWNAVKEIFLGVFIVACIVGVIGCLAWAINSNDRKQIKDDKKIFLECYEKTHDAEWCYDL